MMRTTTEDDDDDAIWDKKEGKKLVKFSKEWEFYKYFISDLLLAFKHKLKMIMTASPRAYRGFLNDAQ